MSKRLSVMPAVMISVDRIPVLAQQLDCREGRVYGSALLSIRHLVSAVSPLHSTLRPCRYQAKREDSTRGFSKLVCCRVEEQEE